MIGGQSVLKWIALKHLNDALKATTFFEDSDKFYDSIDAGQQLENDASPYLIVYANYR